MNRWLRNTLTIAAFVLLLYFNMPAFAQAANTTDVHISEEAAVPRHILEPGNYIFRRMDSTNPNTYELLRDDRTFIGFFNVISTRRAVRGDAELLLSAPDADGVRLVQAWYGPDKANGHEFTYSHREVKKLDRLAEAQNQNIGMQAGEP